MNLTKYDDLLEKYGSLYVSTEHALNSLTELLRRRDFKSAKEVDKFIKSIISGLKKALKV